MQPEENILIIAYKIRRIGVQTRMLLFREPFWEAKSSGLSNSLTLKFSQSATINSIYRMSNMQRTHFTFVQIYMEWGPNYDSFFNATQSPTPIIDAGKLCV